MAIRPQQANQPAPGEYFRGRHCRIIPLGPQHATLLHLWLQQPDFAWTHPSLPLHCPTAGMIRERLEFLAGISPPLEYNCLVLAADSDRPLGVTGLTGVDRVNLKAEFHIGFAERDVPRAVAEALAWGLSQSFGELGLRKLIFYAADGNVRARAFLRRHAFPCEGVLRAEIRGRNDTWVDLHRHALFADAWASSALRTHLLRFSANGEASHA